ncbi:MAG: peptidylprolyl isomerase [Deltaproteobacteria bacterium]|jgi:peptidyl-prolyl cis-trans isomerase C
MKFQSNRLCNAAILVLLAVFAASSVLAAEQDNTQKKAAVVNGSVITRNDFNREVKVLTNRFSAMGQKPNEQQMAELKEAVLNKMIEGKLLFQKAQEEGTIVNDKAVADKLAQIKTRFPNEEKFNQSMASMGVSEADLKSQIKQGLTIQKFLDHKFIQKIKVSDKEAQKFYEENKDKFKQPEMVRASHILIKCPKDADENTKKAARKKIEEIKKQLDQGADFAELAKKDSQGPSSSKGGDLGFFRRGQMVPAFEKAAFALKPGQVSDVVETQFGYHLIKVQEKKPGGTLSFADAKDRIKQFLEKKEVKEQVETYLAELKKKSKIETFLPAKAS